MPTLSQVTVPVIKAFGAHRVGDSITCKPAEALALARQKLVSLTRGYQTRELTQKADPEPEPQPDAPRRRRRYLRADMQAEE